MFNFSHFSTTRTRGFTLIETLVAITILLVSLAGPLTLATRSLNSALVARDQLIAAHLTQDAVEYARFWRDTDVLSGNSWLTTLTQCNTPAVCRVDSTKGATAEGIVVCAGGTCPPLQAHERDFYDYDTSSGTPSSFVRSVTMERVTDNEYIIRVTTTWNTGIIERSISIQEHIFDWTGSATP